MPRVKPGQRIRAQRPKTRTGCRTCKGRRIKCDELRPSCRRCTSTDRICEGYEDIFVDAFAATFQVHPQHSLSSPGTRKELRAVSFFRERTAPQLAGFYDSGFWSRIILSASHANVALRHALVALAAIHEDFEHGRTIEGDCSHFALVQYNKAIQKHLEVVVSGGRATLDNYLAPCLVFVCIEMLQRHFGSALSLVMRAVRMFYDADTEERYASAWPIELLESILGRLQTQAIGLAGTPNVGMTCPPHTTVAAMRGIPNQFSSVAEARDLYDFYSNTFILSMAQTQKGEDIDTEARDKLMSYVADIYTRWSAAFDALRKHSFGQMTLQEQNAVNVLQMRRLMLQTSLAIQSEHPLVFGPQDTWDQYDSEFDQVVDLAESVIATMRPIALGDTRKHSFTLDWGVVGPLYDTARRCRHPRIRREAIKLLYDNPCQEGMWDSVLAARVAERAMELEEQGSCSVETGADVPEEGRITDVTPYFDLDSRTARISYLRCENHLPLVAKWRLEESIHW